MARKPSPVRLGADCRASAGASIAARFIESGRPYTCTASLTRDPDAMEAAERLARDAIAAGARFGYSNSAGDWRHAAGLILDTADSHVRADWRAKRAA